MSMKITRMKAEAAQSAKLHKLEAYGSMKAAKKGENAPRKFASGGPVDMGPVDGMSAKPRLDRPGRKAGKGKDKKAGTNVNVIIMPKGDGPKAAPDMPMPAPAGGPPMPMPPPGAGGPPPGGPMPPMRKSGGKVLAFKTGGKIKRADGGEVEDGDESGEFKVAGKLGGISRAVGSAAKAAPKAAPRSSGALGAARAADDAINFGVPRVLRPFIGSTNNPKKDEAKKDADIPQKRSRGGKAGKSKTC